MAIANDITYNSGAFGPKEDAMFRAATEYALQHHIPVLYLAANSGARVGLANEVKQCLKVEWHNPEEPQKGFKYLYLSDDDYHSITGVKSDMLHVLDLANTMSVSVFDTHCVYERVCVCVCVCVCLSVCVCVCVCVHASCASWMLSQHQQLMVFTSASS